MLSRVLFAFGGFAAGLLTAFAIASFTDSPSAELAAARFETRRLTDVVAEAQKLLDKSDQRNIELTNAMEKGNAALQQLLDEKADLEAELERAEMLAAKAINAKGELQAQLKAAKLSGSQEPEAFPVLGQYEAFQVKSVFSGTFSPEARGDKSKAVFDALGQSMAVRLTAESIPTLELCNYETSGLILIHTQTTGAAPIAGAVTFAVGAEHPQGGFIFLHSGTSVFLAVEPEELPFRLVATTEKLAEIFRDRWRDERAKYLGIDRSALE